MGIFAVELYAANQQLSELRNRLVFMTDDGDTASITTANLKQI